MGRKGWACEGEVDEDAEGEAGYGGRLVLEEDGAGRVRGERMRRWIRTGNSPNGVTT